MAVVRRLNKKRLFLQVVIPYYCRKRHIDPTNEQDVHPALEFLSTVAASHPQSSAERRVALAALAKFKVKDAATALQVGIPWC